ncbi:unnamed protein product, partial [Ixodes persulcatus]
MSTASLRFTLQDGHVSCSCKGNLGVSGRTLYSLISSMSTSSVLVASSNFLARSTLRRSDRISSCSRLVLNVSWDSTAVRSLIPTCASLSCARYFSRWSLRSAADWADSTALRRCISAACWRRLSSFSRVDRLFWSRRSFSSSLRTTWFWASTWACRVAPCSLSIAFSSWSSLWIWLDLMRSDMSLKLASSFSRSCWIRRRFCSCMSSKAWPVTSISLSRASS